MAYKQRSKRITFCSFCHKEFLVEPGQYIFCSLACRFWAKVNKSDNDCWLWLANHDREGYGFIKVNKKMRRATHIAYELTFGEFDRSLFVLHRCDVPACVRPEHLFLGTNKINMIDCSNKGRIAKGSRNGNSKLTSDQVRMIRESSKTQRELTKQFNISKGQVYHIQREIHWKGV